jgi:hypothetical protein
MKTAALIALSLLAGCAVYRSPDGRLERRTPHVTLLLCIFASCHIPSLNERSSDLAGVKRETPTPSPSVCKDESTPTPYASRLGFDMRAEGIGSGVLR